ncbi:MAG: FHA domain-containing protein, partial [Woeseiales bacterium]
LKADLRSKITTIEELEFEVEQLSGKNRGLEEELKARFEITDSLHSEIADSQGRLNDSQQKIDQHNQDTSQLKKSADSAQAKLDRLKTKSDGLHTTIKNLRGKTEKLENELTAKKKQIVTLEKLQKRLTKKNQKPDTKRVNKNAQTLSQQLQHSQTEAAELKTYIDGRKDEWVTLNAEVDEFSRQLADSQSRATNLLTEMDDRNTQLVRSCEQVISTSENLTKQKTQARKLRMQNRELETELNHDAKERIVAADKRLEEQSGEIQGLTHALTELRCDRDQIAQYADTLRMQFQDQVSVSKVSVAMREKLESGLDHANTAINEPSERQKSSQEHNDELMQASQFLKSDFDAQIRQIRFELGSAEETIAGHQSINEQLVSDLFDNRSFQQALEARLGEVEQESNQSVAELGAKLKKARHDAEEIEHKLRNKDSVISDLMRQLSARSDSIELKDDTSNVLQKIDGFKTDAHAPQADTDRVARQLIGNADGKELRFPLFKNRLTIGRTAHNDIQLNMQYISRRHAVISSDHGQTRVIDWGSKNGVFVNNVQVTKKILESGDIVTIGTTDFRYEERSKR